jgi:hypothetical protein
MEALTKELGLDRMDIWAATRRVTVDNAITFVSQSEVFAPEYFAQAPGLAASHELSASNITAACRRSADPGPAPDAQACRR